jgi:hypothetical protein
MVWGVGEETVVAYSKVQYYADIRLGRLHKSSENFRTQAGIRTE